MTMPIDREPSGSEATDSASANGFVPAAPTGNENVSEPLSVFNQPGIARREPSLAFRVFIGSQGLRGGWSVLIFAVLVFTFANIFGSIISALLSKVLHIKLAAETAASTVVNDGEVVLGLAATLAILALIERRRFLDYNLRGPAPVTRFVGGLVAGFAALSVLVGVLYLGGWIRFGAMPAYDASLLRYALVWAFAFLMVGFAEEGVFRCFLQFTLARSLNFWWAMGIVGAMCAVGIFNPARNGFIGVYTMAALGVFPCLYLEFCKSPRSGFWQAAWVGSTAFGFIHTGNKGETWIGILAAAAIGFVFCVSVRVTGSAWWAIGFHAAWDWSETYFYGTADSGYVAKGHLLTTTPAGSALWSGGTDGPEGSILILPIVVLILLAVLGLYGRQRRGDRSLAPE